MELHQQFMSRCFSLAKKGLGFVSPNPMVGAVLVHEGRIIGEGYHQRYGGAHAEVNAFNSVQETDKLLIPLATMYVSLEPCSHFGKTPPCSDLIIKMGIKQVVMAMQDPFAAVNGSGYAKLVNAGISVISSVLEDEAQALNCRFICNQQHHRPYIILKWAQTSSGYISGANGQPIKISDSITDRLVHQWRGEEDAILVGVNTVLKDNPRLSNRMGNGKQPIKIIFDPRHQVPSTAAVFSEMQTTIVFTFGEHPYKSAFAEYISIDSQQPWLEQVLLHMHKKGIGSVLVEGGAKTHQSFIVGGLWDEARVITSTIEKTLDEDISVKAANLYNHYEVDSMELGNDLIQFYKKQG
jgi:diaminohydroxyphosphoribosylaminopyrimidine deaminase/5-amino-6-(5-phosphoribosylamino)uracil reductase